MKEIAEQIRNSNNSFALELLYNKLEQLESKFNDSLISYIDYSFSKDDVVNDINGILSLYSCPIDLLPI